MNYDPAPDNPFHNNPVNIEEFYAGFVDRYLGRANRLTEIFNENHIQTADLGANLFIGNFTTSLSGTPPTVYAGDSFDVIDTTTNFPEPSRDSVLSLTQLLDSIYFPAAPSRGETSGAGMLLR